MDTLIRSKPAAMVEERQGTPDNRDPVPQGPRPAGTPGHRDPGHTYKIKARHNAGGEKRVLRKRKEALA